jgi:hypothetical protein
MVGCISLPMPHESAGPPDLGVIGGFNPKPWAPILAIAPVDKPATLADRVRGLEETMAFSRAFLTRFSLSAATQKLWDNLWESLNTLNIASIYQLAVADDKAVQPLAWRQFVLRGGRIERDFLLEVQAGTATDWPIDRPVAKFGQMRGAISLRPSQEQSDTFLFRSDMEVDVGGLCWDDLVEALAKVIEAVDLTVHDFPTSAKLPENLEKAVQLRFPKLEGDSLLLMAEWMRAYPNLTALIPCFIIPENLVHRRARVPLMPAWTEVDMVVSLHREYLEYHYPDYASFINSMAGMLEATFVLKDANGNVLLTVMVDTKTFSLSIKAAICQGRLVPKNSAGELLYEHAADVHAQAADLCWEGMMLIHVSGIELELANLKLYGHYGKWEDFAILKWRFCEPPRAKVSGALWGFIPVGVLDFFIPSNLEELATKFLKALANSNGGEGLKMQFSYARGATQGRIVFHVATELEDSGFFGFLMRIFHSRMLPSPEANAQKIKIIAALLDAWHADFALFARYHRLSEEK